MQQHRYTEQRTGMYLGTGDIIATLIAIVGALTVMGLAIKQNIALNSENAWLRKRNQQLKKLVSHE